jgi:hypothetical protein
MAYYKHGAPMELWKTSQVLQTSPRTKLLSWVLTGVFSASCAVLVVTLCFAPTVLKSSRWWEVPLVSIGLAATWITVSRALPWQNVLSVSAIIGLVATGFEVLTSLFHHSGRLVLNASIIWPAALVWVIAILNARAVARLALVRWRSVPAYGLWLLGLNMLIALGFVIGWRALQAVAGESVASNPLTTIGAQAAFGNFLQVGATVILAVLLAAPFLVNKQPQEQMPAIEPIIFWLSFSLVSVIAAWVNLALLTASILALSNGCVLGLIIAGRILVISQKSYDNS